MQCYDRYIRTLPGFCARMSERCFGSSPARLSQETSFGVPRGTRWHLPCSNDGVHPLYSIHDTSPSLVERGVPFNRVCVPKSRHRAPARR